MLRGYVWSVFHYGLCLCVMWLCVVCVYAGSVCHSVCVAEDARGPSVQAGLVSPLLVLLKDDQRVQCQIQAGRALGNICYENGKSRLEENGTGMMIPHVVPEALSKFTNQFWPSLVICAWEAAVFEIVLTVCGDCILYIRM